jgi:hypothetical protein
MKKWWIMTSTRGDNNAVAWMTVIGHLEYALSPRYRVSKYFSLTIDHKSIAKYTSHVMKSLDWSWGCSSVIKLFPSMCSALAWIPSTENDNFLDFSQLCLLARKRWLLRDIRVLGHTSFLSVVLWCQWHHEDGLPSPEGSDLSGF